MHPDLIMRYLLMVNPSLLVKTER